MCRGASLVAQTVKNLPAMQDTWVRSLGSKDPLKEGMATHSSLLAWETPGTDKPGGLQMVGVPVSFKMLVFSGCIPRHRIAGSEGTSLFCFLRLSILFSLQDLHWTFPTTVQEHSLLSTPSLAFIFEHILRWPF